MLAMIAFASHAFATGEPSTYFQIYVPPSGATVHRDVALVVTAIYDSTSFEIIDDGADGDTDDSKTGMLMAGQSYVLYLRDNGINDDARYASGGTLKWDGDYFIIKSNKLVYAAQSTNSDWQHDWVPPIDKSSTGRKFLIWAPPYSNSKNDINVFAYQDSTVISFVKISVSPTTTTGYTNVDMSKAVTVFTRTINVGEDIIYKYPDGRDAMDAGETYMLVSNKPVSVQYGALYGDERDGGGYVPTSNGSASGELMYFGVPYQVAGEQEIRIVSWDDGNQVQLSRFSNGSWVPVQSYNLDRLKPGDWVGRSNGNVAYPTVFRITCTPGKRVSVFEGNWFETSDVGTGTADMATMLSSENGTTSGTAFLSYIAPPGDEVNVVDPFTGKIFGQNMSHLYLFSKMGATVTVKDAYTNGTKFNRTYVIAAGRYADCGLTLADWKGIYNGTGTTSGPERPYLLVTSDQPISIMNSNFNDNWMCYFGSPMEHGFTQTATISQPVAKPADTVNVVSVVTAAGTVQNPQVQVIVQNGLVVVGSQLSGNGVNNMRGTVTVQPTQSVVSFPKLPDLPQSGQYTVQTTVVASSGTNTGVPITSAVNSTVETIVTGTVNGQIQQSASTETVNVNPNNTSGLIFSRFTDNVFTKDTTDSWTISWVDVNNDGYDDIFTTDRSSNAPNLLYINNKNGTFTKAGSFMVKDSAISISSTWADVDNDGDLDFVVLNNTRKPNTFYRNNGDGTFTKDASMAFAQTVAYYTGGAFADYDRDGKVDLFLCNFFPTRYNELYRNNGTNGFTKKTDDIVCTQADQSAGPTWADYDQDGFPDLFVPNGSGFHNSLFHNEGNGTFKLVNNVITSEGGESVGSCWGDYDNDGDLDLFVANANKQGNFLYRNDGNGKFTKITTGVVVTDKGASHGCSFADIDNDGDLDLYVTNDAGQKFLYINDGKGNFTRKPTELVEQNYGNAFGHAWSDFDHDGDLDLVVATHSGQPNVLFVNNGNSNGWLEVKLTGTASNASAIGADIFIKANGQWQMREVNAQSGFGGQSSFTQHFGLGNATQVDSMIIKWPSGTLQYLTNVAGKQILAVTEPKAIKVAGIVFNDRNGNCIKDPGEELMGQTGITIKETGGKCYTNNNGIFTTSLLSGSYTFQLASDNTLAANCTPKQVTIGQSFTDTVLMAASVLCDGSDPTVLMGSTAIRNGYSNNQFTWIVGNNGREATGVVKARLKMPATVMPGTPSIPFSSIDAVTENGINKRIYNWVITSIAPFQRNVLSFNYGMASSVNIGDTTNFTTWLETTGTNCNITNDSVSQTYAMVGAIDPNDLTVSPVGYGAEGYIMPTQLLTYTIQFQNVGNEAASAVTVKDILPEGLDMATLKIVAKSHEGIAMETQGNEVTFYMDDIYLSDSATNATNSQGFITFSIAPVSTIAPGTTLINKATVQFDNLVPMATNSVINTIQSKAQEQSGIVVKTYPNPANDEILISLKDIMGDYTAKTIRLVELYDIVGRRVLNRVFNPGDKTHIDLPMGLHGMYVVRVTDTEGKTYSSTLLVQQSGYAK